MSESVVSRKWSCLVVDADPIPHAVAIFGGDVGMLHQQICLFEPQMVDILDYADAKGILDRPALIVLIVSAPLGQVDNREVGVDVAQDALVGGPDGSCRLGFPGI